MDAPLAAFARLPQVAVAAGDTLIREGVRTDRLYLVESGEFEVSRNGVRIVSIGERGALLGEMSVVLGSAPTADVVATRDGTVRVLENASAAVQAQPALVHAIAQLLARRLAAVTSYLVDIKRQYAGTDSHLALMDEVLGNLMAMNPHGGRLGSERQDAPDY